MIMNGYMHIILSSRRCVIALSNIMLLNWLPKGQCSCLVSNGAKFDLLIFKIVLFSVNMRE